MTVKEQLRRAIDSLPDNASFEDAMDRLYLLYKIQRGTDQLDRGEGIPHDEARERILDKWAK